MHDDAATHPSEHASPARAARDVLAHGTRAAARDEAEALAEERRHPASGRRAVDRRVMAVVEWMSDAFLALDPEWRVIYANQEAARLNGTTPDALVGRDHWAVWPEAVGSEVERRYREAVRTGTPAQFEHYYEQSGVWHDVRAYPSPDGGLAIFYRDISAQKQLEAERNRALRAAQTASLAKSQFLANTSHEIRTPLNAVIGYTELLELELAGPLSNAQRHYVARIRGASDHLLTLINDVLDLSKIEAGAMRTAREPGLARDSVTTATQLLEPQIRERGLRLVNGCAGDAAYRGDADRVRQILVNLLSNAVRFTEPGGRITITCGGAPVAPADVAAVHEGAFTFMRVEDTGTGIPPAELERIFDAFVQVDARRTRRHGGSGLGLTISRHLARLMGGDLTVRSTPEQGSSFVLWLPAADPAEVRPADDAGPAAARAAAAPLDAGAAPALLDGTSPLLAPPGATAAAADEAMATLARADAAQLRELSDALLTETERVLTMYVARLRVDPGTPSARGLDEALAEDHMVTFLADLASCLAAAGTADTRLSLQDGTEIQRLIADRHGRQRARLGWKPDELRREWQLLREELHAAVERRVTRGGGAPVAQAHELIEQLLGSAERASVVGFERGRA